MIEKRQNSSNFFNEPVITLVYPIVNKDQTVVFALYLHSEVSGVMAAKEGVFRIIGLLLFLVLVVLYWSSTSLPIK